MPIVDMPLEELYKYQGINPRPADLEPRIAKATLVHPFLSDYKRVWEMDLAVRAYEGIQTFFRWFDPLYECDDAIFQFLKDLV